MSKGLEIINFYENSNYLNTFHPNFMKDLQIVKKELQRLESIDNANPSEVLEDLYGIRDNLLNVEYLNEHSEADFKNIEQVLLKSQEQEKEIAYIEKIKTMMKQKDCVLRYIESEDCFAVTTILSDGWYKLTPEFVENNVKEEIKPLPLIEKNKQLREENAELKKVLEIIKKKVMPLVSIDDVCVWDAELYQYITITEEEFDLLKRYFKWQQMKF